MDAFIGHRGVRNHAPENTARGFEMCAVYFKWVEFDATLTQDEQVVIFHDNDIKKLTNSTGLIGEKTLSNLENIKTQGEPIPTLIESVKHFESLGLNMNLEIKVNDERWEILTDKIIDVINTHYTHKTDLLFSSFSHDALLHLRKKMPNAIIGHLFEVADIAWEEQAQAVGAKNVHFNKENLDQDTISRAKELGYGVYVFSVNTKHEFDRLMSWGVDGIFTDEKPEIFTN